MQNMEDVYRTYAVPVKRYVMSLCNDNALADDITAETFYKAVQHIDQFHDGKLFTWLCAIARNTWLDAVKKKENQNTSISEEMEIYLADDSRLPEDSCVQKDERLTLYRQIQRLESEAKDVVYLRIFAELSFKEIGSILGKTENWARVTFYRSKEKLKGWMEDEN
ncbi:MAG: sigma-70 family RNA polymerase sigma factor [Peptococcaceae bacterium]|nr:sigma-70 family RNA polymerase sigma factor [Peptococcaceae bacterium]